MMLPSFREFFVAVYGKEPFPWQERLAEQVIAKGWSAYPLLDLPTGAGKTSALDIALYALARAPERMPRRTVLIVDRRIVVDEGAIRARNLLGVLRRAKDGPLRALADALRGLSSADPNDPPFAVSVMRGGMPRDDDWARSPEIPVLGLSTVDQVGSRMFFRGYGIAPRSASIHAGLLGNDTLLLLDEVHLAQPFAQTLEAARRYRSRAGLPDRFAVVQMSATPGAPADAPRFGRGNEDWEEDRRHPVLRPRLRASKRARLVPVKVTGDDEAWKLDMVADVAVREALDLQKKGAKVVGIVLNRVDGARRARAKFAARSDSTDSMLVTGRMRPIERDFTVRALQERAGPRDRSKDVHRPLVVVATQCLEAGADLDFDALVTECASLDALRQRFGRLDRQGYLEQTSAVVLGRSDATTDDDDPIYGASLKGTWNWLHANAVDGVIDFGIEALPSSADLTLLSPRPNAPVLLPAHLEAWAQTSPRPDFDPDIGLWLHGPEKAAADVQVVFRADLDLNATLEATVERLLAARPSSLEAISVPIGAARRWLARNRASAIADVMAGDTEPDVESRDADEKPIGLRWRGDGSEWASAKELRPGDTLIVPASRGGLRDRSFDPESAEPVIDVGDLAALRGRAVAQLRLGPTQLDVWALPPELVAEAPVPNGEETAAELRERVREWMRRTPERLPPDAFPTEAEWVAFRSAFIDGKVRLTRTGSGAVLTVRLDPAVLRGEVVDSITEDDDSPFIGRDVTLRSHSEDVRGVVGRFARSLGLSDQITSDLELAGWLHDVGKADGRFQRWLVGGSEVALAELTEPLAKSRFPDATPAERRSAQERAGYPAGYRHELLSLAMARGSRALAAAHDVELVLHLVASHHGFARPFAPFDDHPDDLPVALDHGGIGLEATTRHRLGRLGSDVPARFLRVQEKYGWWGLAWLEAILRLADHHASRIREEGGAP
jgi:CRISPR-associated endonuclease/helicase Cas3